MRGGARRLAGDGGLKMSRAGPLLAIGLSCFFAGLYNAVTREQLFKIREDWALAALGAAMAAAAFVMVANGVG
jgi:hypothetical protein